MAISVKHTKNLAKADGIDSTVVQPSDWNAEHTLTAASGKVLGTTTSSTTVGELPIAVDGSGNVGIGTSSPGAKLDVNGTIGINGSTGTAGQVLVSNGSSAPSWDVLGVTGGGTGAATAANARTNLGLGSAATLNTGTAAGNVVQLDGSARLPAVDGSLLTNMPVAASSGRLLRAPQILTSGTSYTTPAGCNSIYVECVGPGGPGGTADGINSNPLGIGGGGGSGAYCAKLFSVSPSTAYSYAIGASGVSNTTFTVGATTITAGGGAAGGSATNGLSSIPVFSVAQGGAGGTASGGDINISGTAGSPGFAYKDGSGTNLASGSGGGSFFGGGASGVSSHSVGIAGTSGGGGSGGGATSTSARTGGAGGAGLIRIWEYS